MSAHSDAMEREVAAIIAINEGAIGAGRSRTLRENIAVDRHFSQLMIILGGRIRHFTKVYGLTDMRDDAQQACAIAIHRAIESYDPEQARFTTFVTWQLRGELQGLRHRVRLDQRESAKKMGARTVSLEPHNAGTELEFTIHDENAQERTEAGASQLMAARCANALLDEWEQAMRARDKRHASLALNAKLAFERGIVTRFLTDTPEPQEDDTLTGEQKRQVTRRVLRHCSQLAGSQMTGSQWRQTSELQLAAATR
ncbi:sigma-70 family RNA polymerase sigma factor [Altererythrobacter confluentis]|uniref:Sigma-70 family RNA polymerase sigma factor n=1 Tax=Allopontixanthobacter confluentis TaxID=1849021 RepID=A0A6L7GIJ6_9SPHN|nr:sigma factor [Allopontixanthobacter confluentis]MXP15124.1 sigma-70 family RNA polymerase sigma factor [Allopontixanthobacter confluentis]